MLYAIPYYITIYMMKQTVLGKFTDKTGELNVVKFQPTRIFKDMID